MKKQDFSTEMLFSAIVFIAICVIAYLIDAILPQRVVVEGYAPSNAWIGTAISAAAGLAGSLLANQQKKRATAALDEAQQNLTDWRNGVVGTNVLDRADSMSMLKAYRDILDEQNKKNNTGAIKGGLTDEAQVAQAVAVNKGLADAASRIAGYGQQQKDRVEQLYQQQLYGYETTRAKDLASGAQATVDAIAKAGGTLGSILSGINWGKKEEEV